MALICLVTTCATATGLWFTVPVFHQAGAQLVLLNPARLDGEGRALPTNPLVIAGSRPAQVMTSTLVTIADGEIFRDELEAGGITSDVTVTGTTGGGIVLQLSAIARDPAVAARDLQQLEGALERELDRRQVGSGAPDNQLYALYEFVPRSEPVRLTDDRTRSVALSAALGLVLTVFALVLAGAGPVPRPDAPPSGRARQDATTGPRAAP